MESSGPTGTPSVSARDLTKTYASGPTYKVALEHVTFRAGPREFVAVVGSAGAGRSTLLHCLAGITAPTSGSVYVGMRNLTKMTPRRRAKFLGRTIGAMLEDLGLLPDLTARDNILYPARRRVSESQFQDMVDALGIRTVLHRKPEDLSYGDRQLVALARAMVFRPKLLVLDKPTLFLDHEQEARVGAILKSLVNREGTTVVAATDSDDFAAGADRVVLLKDGRIASEVKAPTLEKVQELLGTRHGDAAELSSRQPDDATSSGEEVDQPWPVTLTDDYLPDHSAMPSLVEGEGDPVATGKSVSDLVESPAGPTQALSKRQVDVIDRAKQILDSLPGAVAPEQDWIEDLYSEDQSSRD
ncbi:ATP-binding cassette domain-containing protein [Actinomycetaceae bacterium MB13-C1-2]|nr:ATP-binding cassette domain-containing protein [Actinomycetaceae bacterium MB13-C1-2]